VSRERIGPDDLKPQKIVGYRLDDACAALGISARTMRRLREEGRVEAILIKKSVLIAPREMERLLAHGVRKYRRRSAREEHPPP
jgi:predicted site-specific integrase-resolvase